MAVRLLYLTKVTTFVCLKSGAGTILQALRLHKKMIVIVNESLLDNHQAELAQAMAMKKYVLYSDIR
jgi:beta-1,4-N-acetylglucosaminyltransferase